MAHDCHQGSHDNSVAFFKLCDALMVILKFLGMVINSMFQSVHRLLFQPLLLFGGFYCVHYRVINSDQKKNDRYSTDKLLK